MPQKPQISYTSFSRGPGLVQPKNNNGAHGRKLKRRKEENVTGKGDQVKIRQKKGEKTKGQVAYRRKAGICRMQMSSLLNIYILLHVRSGKGVALGISKSHLLYCLSGGEVRE
jgi:hypothetical protein